MINIINFIKGHGRGGARLRLLRNAAVRPELKFYSNRVKMDTDFNTSVKGLHCLGDSSGWTRGLMMASVMGVLMGRAARRHVRAKPWQHVIQYGPPGCGKTCAARLVLEEARRQKDSPFDKKL